MKYATVMVGMMASALSMTIVNVAVPDMTRYFAIGHERAQWISAAFMLAMTSNKFCALRLPRSTTSISLSVAISIWVAELSSKSESASNKARKPTKRSGSLSTTEMRMGVFFANAGFINLPVRAELHVA